jgi:hypothetical protein
MSDATPDADVPAKPPRRFRRLRIAVSVFFGVITVILCVWWNGASEMNEALNSSFGLGRDPRSLDVYLYLAFLSLTLASSPWLAYLPRQWSVRTMLIATTLVAIALGCAMWAVG